MTSRNLMNLWNLTNPMNRWNPWNPWNPMNRWNPRNPRNLRNLRNLRNPIVALIAVVSVHGAATQTTASQPPVDVRLTQKHATVVCLDGKAVTPDTRRWKLQPGPHAVSVTMRNEPRSGIATAAAGVATVPFTLEAGHRYELEVRAPSDAFSSRVWTQGAWTPVLRDRTTDRLVSGEPDWQPPDCK